MTLTDPACAPALASWAHGYDTEFEPTPPHLRFVRVADGKVRCYCCRNPVPLAAAERAVLADYLPPVYFKAWVRVRSGALAVTSRAETFDRASRPVCVAHLSEPAALPLAADRELAAVRAVLLARARRRHARLYTKQLTEAIELCQTAARELDARTRPPSRRPRPS